MASDALLNALANNRVQHEGTRLLHCNPDRPRLPDAYLFCGHSMRPARLNTKGQGLLSSAYHCNRFVRCWTKHN
jgi:hypothetical protein